MKTNRIGSLIILISITISTHAQELNPKEIVGIIEQIPPLILEHYVIREKRAAIATAFSQHIATEKYLAISHPDSLTKILTQDLRAISNDKHLYVTYLPPGEKEEAFDWDAWEREERRLEKVQNFGFTEIRILEGNIGYLKIVEFMHPKRGMHTAVAAMKFVEHTAGLIIDIRGNGGGYGGLMNYVLNHYFEGGPTHISTTIYSAENQLPDKEYSSDLVYGKLRTQTPLYIITDHKTGSAAEFFAYTLQAFGKAQIVGQRTAGAAHMNTYYPLTPNFRISISTAAPINPKTNTNWENKGVIPDHEVKENELAHALELIVKEVKALSQKE